MPCIPLKGGGVLCIRGPRPRAPCDEEGCNEVHEYLCDGPAPRRKSGTCDRRLCRTHAHEAGTDRHLCPAHHREEQRTLF